MTNQGVKIQLPSRGQFSAAVDRLDQIWMRPRLGSAYQGHKDSTATSI
jgi:hypothetical protein